MAKRKSRKPSQKTLAALAETGKPFRFKPGHSGNPGGRPKDPFSKRLRELANDEAFRERALRVFFKRIEQGDVRAIKELFDRVEGKVANRVEVTGAGGEEIKAKVDAKLSVGDLVGALRDIYGLTRKE